MTWKTVSEGLFGQSLESQGLAFEFETLNEGKSQRPDYTVAIGGKDYLFEVKESEPVDLPR